MIRILVLIITIVPLLNACVGYVAIKHVPETTEEHIETSKASLIQTWGQPAKIETINNLEYLTYNREVSFDGILLGLIIPIPIGIPVFNKITYIIENGVYRRKITYYPEATSAFLCGIITAGHLEFGCYAK